MPGGYMFGWDDAAGGWVRVQCDANGLLTVDSSLLFENPPTEDEATKGPSSEWAFDHNANVAAHHAKYTDVESRAAIDDLFSSTGLMLRDMHCDYHQIVEIKGFNFKYSAADTYFRTMVASVNTANIRFLSTLSGVGYRNCRLQVYKTDHYVYIADFEDIPGQVALLLENPPTEDLATKAPTSEWAFDHDADVAAHHAKYTDLQAQQACNLDGNLYWSCVGAAFGGLNPDTDSFHLSLVGYLISDTAGLDILAPVDLPDGATITGAIVYGNAAAEDESWYLYRMTLTNHAQAAVATAVVNTEDTTIQNPLINNSLYAYYLLVTDLQINDEIYGARIIYTL